MVSNGHGKIKFWENSEKLLIVKGSFIVFIYFEKWDGFNTVTIIDFVKDLSILKIFKLV